MAELSNNYFVGNERKRKKRSFVQTVRKKFLKTNPRIYGTNIDYETRQYFLRVLQQSTETFTEDERRAFVGNVFMQTEGHEVEYCSNQLVSRIIENLLPECSETVLLQYINSLGEDLRLICGNQYASHVLEKLLVISAKAVCYYKRSHTKDDNISNETIEACSAFVLKVSRFLLNNLDEFVLLDQYANHVLRTALTCLCGSFDETSLNSKYIHKGKIQNENCAQKDEAEGQPKDFIQLIKEFADFVLKYFRFSEYASNVQMSGFVQSVLLALHSVKKNKQVDSITIKLLDVIYSVGKKESNIAHLLANQEAVHLLNTMINVSSERSYEEIRRCLEGELNDLALSRSANYCVQKLIDRCSDPNAFTAIYDELAISFQQILQYKFTGVLFSISKACARLHTKESSFITAMKNTLGCNDDGRCFVYCLITLNPQHSVQTEGINLHGSLILQELLKFNKVNKVMKNILLLDGNQLVNILCDQKGSHIADVILGSEMKNEKQKYKFIDKLMGCYVKLATNKFGSFAISKSWKVARFDQKLLIVKELAAKESMLMNNDYGVIVANSVALDMYRHQPKKWEDAQKKLFSAKKMFSDILTK